AAVGEAHRDAPLNTQWRAGKEADCQTIRADGGGTGDSTGGVVTYREGTGIDRTRIHRHVRLQSNQRIQRHVCRPGERIPIDHLRLHCVVFVTTWLPARSSTPCTMIVIAVLSGSGSCGVMITS